MNIFYLLAAFVHAQNMLTSPANIAAGTAFKNTNNGNYLTIDANGNLTYTVGNVLVWDNGTDVVATGIKF